jgi:hypothetical protein
MPQSPPALQIDPNQPRPAMQPSPAQFIPTQQQIYQYPYQNQQFVQVQQNQQHMMVHGGPIGMGLLSFND